MGIRIRTTVTIKMITRIRVIRRITVLTTIIVMRFLFQLFALKSNSLRHQHCYCQYQTRIVKTQHMAVCRYVSKKKYPMNHEWRPSWDTGSRPSKATARDILARRHPQWCVPQVKGLGFSWTPSKPWLSFLLPTSSNFFTCNQCTIEQRSYTHHISQWSRWNPLKSAGLACKRFTRRLETQRLPKL